MVLLERGVWMYCFFKSQDSVLFIADVARASRDTPQ